MLKIAFCDDETAEIAQLEELLEEYAAARGQEFVLTASPEFAVESYAVDAWYYQLKPIRQEDFFRLMDSACAACSKEQTHSLILRSKNGIVRVELEKLVYCEVMGRTLTFHLNSGVVLESMGLPHQYGVHRQHRSPLHHDAGRGRGAAAPREVFGNEGPLPELYF